MPGAASENRTIASLLGVLNHDSPWSYAGHLSVTMVALAANSARGSSTQATRRLRPRRARWGPTGIGAGLGNPKAHAPHCLI